MSQEQADDASLPQDAGRVDARRTARLAQNEALFRQVNHLIAQTVEGVSDEHVNEFACECARIDCTREIPMTLAEYRSIRRDPLWFFVWPGHEMPDIEVVVDSASKYKVVQKTTPPGPAIAVERAPQE